MFFKCDNEKCLDVEMRKKGFTLIELLVVIAIIALLLSILLPSLQMVKRQAQAVICKSNLRQWGLTWKMYTGDNDGKFPGEPGGSTGFKRSWWATCLTPYLGKDNRGKGIYFCPAATRDPQLPEPRYPADEFTTYKLGKIGSDNEEKRASYGINCWTYNDPKANDAFLRRSWKRADVPKAKNIPLLLDGKWRGGFPEHTDKPLMSPDQIADHAGDLLDGSGNVGEMCHFQMKRHKYGINAVFLDYSVRIVKPIELWSLKWHKEFDTRYAETNITWEDWMK